MVGFVGWVVLVLFWFFYPNTGHTGFSLNSSVTFNLATSNRWAGIWATLLLGLPNCSLCSEGQWQILQATPKPHTLVLLCLEPLLHCCLQTRCRQLRLVSLSFLECKRYHQNLQDQVVSQTVTEESKNIQVKFTTIISRTLCRHFRFLIEW